MAAGMSKTRTRPVTKEKGRRNGCHFRQKAEQLESEMLGQEYDEGRDNETDQVSKLSPFSKRYLVPARKVTTEVESKDSRYTDLKPGISQGCFPRTQRKCLPG